MRYTLFFSIVLFLQNSLVAQSGEWRVLGGIKMSARWQTQAYGISGDDVFWQIESTEPISLGTYSLIYSRKISTKWAWSLGLNYNAKGIRQKGIFYDATVVPDRYIYAENRINKYIGSLIGARYTFFDKKGWQFGTEVLMNPEVEMQGYGNMKKFALSSMAVLNIEKTLNRHLSVVLNPFFESSLMPYSKKGTFGYFDYNPFGYGLTLGVKYRKN